MTDHLNFRQTIKSVSRSATSSDGKAKQQTHEIVIDYKRSLLPSLQVYGIEGYRIHVPNLTAALLRAAGAAGVPAAAGVAAPAGVAAAGSLAVAPGATSAEEVLIEASPSHPQPRPSQNTNTCSQRISSGRPGAQRLQCSEFCSTQQESDIMKGW